MNEILKEKISRRQFAKTVGLGAAALSMSGTMATFLSSCARKGPEPIIIGQQADLSGSIASWGYWLNKSAKIAVDNINSSGGINGRPVKFVVEDTETNPSTGSRKLRKLILEDKADFVVGSVHSGVMLASNPIAKELKTIYCPLGMASEATAELGNRYVFRIDTHVIEQVEASANWLVNNSSGPHSKRWTICVSDYSWGYSHEEWFTRKVEEAGGKILTSIRIPLGTKDFVPYLTKIPKETESLYFVFFGADSLGFIQQLHDTGYKGNKYTVICTLEAIDLTKLGDAIEGAWVLEYLPRQLNEYNTEYNRKLRDWAKVDSDGREIGNPSRIVAGSHYWATYETIYMVKKAMEQINWNSKKDTPKLIEAIEGMEMKESIEHPEGDNFIRKEDHQGFHRHWMSRVENGKLKVKFMIPAKDVLYPATVDYTKEVI